MELTELLGELGKLIGLELRLDESGSCMLAVDDMSVVIQDVSEAFAVGFWGKIGRTPPEGQLQLCQLMLEANHLFRATAGATISRNPESGEFFLCRLLDLRGLDAETFISNLEKFVNVLESWQRLVADYRPGAAPDGRRESARSEGGGLQDLCGGFIRI